MLPGRHRDPRPTGLVLPVRREPAPALRVEKDLPYREAEGYSQALNTLDVYYATRSVIAAKRPVAVFLHGGNWRGGDKACFTGAAERVPAWFVERGFVFVSVNFRLFGSDEAGVGEMTDDIAKALKWLTVNGRKFGAASGGFLLVGYSSGAHLGALVTAKRELHERHRLPEGCVAAFVGLDVPFYDVPQAIAHLRRQAAGASALGQRLDAALQVMGASEAAQLAVSPSAHLGPWMQQVRFLLFSAGLQSGRPSDFSRAMGADFVRQLRNHQVVARHEHLAHQDHADVLGLLPGRAGAVLSEFLGLPSARV